MLNSLYSLSANQPDLQTKANLATVYSLIFFLTDFDSLCRRSSAVMTY